MGRLEILAVENARMQRQFIAFPYEFYRQCPYWVPPLRRDQKELFDRTRHPFHRHATMQGFLARREGRTVGRVAAIHDPRHNEFQGENAGFFGFLEMVEDPDVTIALLKAARAWLSRYQVEVIRGPVNPSTNYECGVLVDGFDAAPMVMMTYNPAYYGALIEQAGLRTAKDLLAYYIPTREANAGRVGALTTRASAMGMRIRPINMARFWDEVETAWGIYNSAWSKNWGFVPMTREEFIHHAKQMKPVLVPELTLIAEMGDQVAGFAAALPDINQALKHARGKLFPLGLLKLLWYRRSIRRLRVVLLGIREEFRATPAAAGLYAALIRAATRLRYEGAECSWILEDNVLMRRSIEMLGGAVYKTYRIYEWRPGDARNALRSE